MRERNVKAFYREQYQEVYGSGCLGWASKLVHKSLENGLSSADSFGVVLELGAGHGQHLPFVRHNFNTYLETDINHQILPFRSKEKFPGVTNRVVDAQTLEGIAPQSVDRLVASCLLPHLPNPEAALRNWLRVLKPGSSASIYVPAEPGLLLRIAQSATSRRKIEKLGLEYWLAHYREHPWHFPYLRRLIDDVFSKSKINWRSYPMPGVGWNLSLWSVARIRVSS